MNYLVKIKHDGQVGYYNENQHNKMVGYFEASRLTKQQAMNVCEQFDFFIYNGKSYASSIEEVNDVSAPTSN